MRQTGFVISALVFAVTVSASDSATPNIEPGKPLDYGAISFYPKKWKEQGQNPTLYPWQGKHIVLLTTKPDLDQKIMTTIVDRLDSGWEFYEAMVGQSPRRYKLVNGKPPIAAVPDGRLTCGYGCGMIGATGIEVAGFYSRDYPLVAKYPKAFPHYYFYEMGRNYFVFGDRHSAFTTGYAVFMRYCCMDALECEDKDAKTREQIEKAEEVYSKTALTFLEGFTTQGGMGEKTPRLKGVPGPSDQPVIYASAMLKLRKEHGGDAWVKRFFRQLILCPQIKPDTPERALQQSLGWIVAASVAAGEDLSPVFVDRWRFPMGENTREAMQQVNWNQKGLSAKTVLKKLPSNPQK